MRLCHAWFEYVGGDIFKEALTSASHSFLLVLMDLPRMIRMIAGVEGAGDQNQQTCLVIVSTSGAQAILRTAREGARWAKGDS